MTSPPVLELARYNPTDVRHDYKAPSRDRTHAFNQIVRSHGVHSIRRQELGQDIDSACGQLVVKNLKLPVGLATAVAAAAPQDIEDMGIKRGGGAGGTTLRGAEAQAAIHRGGLRQRTVDPTAPQPIVRADGSAAAPLEDAAATTDLNAATAALTAAKTTEFRILLVVVVIGVLYLLFRLITKLAPMPL